MLCHRANAIIVLSNCFVPVITCQVLSDHNKFEVLTQMLCLNCVKSSPTVTFVCPLGNYNKKWVESMYCLSWNVTLIVLLSNNITKLLFNVGQLNQFHNFVCYHLIHRFSREPATSTSFSHSVSSCVPAPACEAQLSSDIGPTSPWSNQPAQRILSTNNG